MKKSELDKLVKVSYDQVARWGRDAARIYHAVVALDQELLDLKSQLDDRLERCQICGKFPEMRRPCTC